MANSTVQMLQDRVAADPRDSEAWQALSEELAALRRADPARMTGPLVETLSSIVQRFPTAAKQWKMLADIELERGNNTGAKDIFSQCLVACAHVGLWASYMDCIKSDNAQTGDEGKLQIMRAYEYTLEKLGQDSSAGALWADFLQFMSSIPVNTATFAKLFQPEMGKEASKRALRLRDLFQRALLVPSEHLDRLWSEYERFERATAARNNPTAGRFIDEWRPRFQAAREAWTTRKRFLDALDRDALPVAPGRDAAGPLPRFREQYSLWMKFLEQESANAQGLDGKTLRRRVDLSYEQALLPLRKCPEVWYQWACAWDDEQTEARRPHAIQVLTKAREALPNCVMLAFALADIHESNGMLADATQVYEDLVRRLQEGDGSDLSPEAGNKVWIQYMYYQKRTGATLQEGQQKARKLFIRASKWPHCSWHVFACHALMEWQLQRMTQPQQLHQSITVVKNIFEHGLRQPHIQAAPGYIDAFASWLVGTTGDVDNARMLFLNALADEACHKDPEMWDAFQRFEAKNGSLNDVLTCERRRSAAMADAHVQLPRLDAVQTLLSRYSHFGLWPCSAEQRRHLEHCIEGRPDASGAAGVGSDASGLPTNLAIFVSKLPPVLEGDQPLPDVDFLLDVIKRANLSAPPSGKSVYDTAGSASHGVKRPLEGDEAGSGPSPLYSDVFHRRQLKMKIDGM